MDTGRCAEANVRVAILVMLASGIQMTYTQACGPTVRVACSSAHTMRKVGEVVLRLLCEDGCEEICMHAYSRAMMPLVK